MFNNINYEAQITKHYDAAAKYYERRKKIFLNLYKKQFENSFNIAQTELMNSFFKAFQKWQNKVLNSLNVEGQLTKQVGIASFTYNGKKINTGLTPQQLLGKNPAEQKRILAFPFEKALTSFLKQQEKTVKDTVESFTVQHVGNVVQEGFTFGGNKKMVRSDFLFKTGNSKKPPQKLELQASADSNIQKISAKYSNPQVYEKELMHLMSKEGYLNKNNFAGGFSVKNYSKNIVYTHSKILMDEVNKALLKMHEINQSSRENDQGDQAELTMRYILSKHVIAITSPTVVGLITNKEVKWMSDILKTDRYVFHLRYDQDQKNFYVGNTGIYFADKNRNSIIYSIWSNNTLSGLEQFYLDCGMRRVL